MELIIKILAIWGGFLSTVLATLKLWERFSTPIEVGRDLDGRPEVGNTITVRNISNQTIIITYWELQFRKREGLRWKTYNSIDPEDGRVDISVKSHSSKEFVFRDECYFDWGYKVMKNKRLYFKICIAGKKFSRKYLIYKG